MRFAIFATLIVCAASAARPQVTAADQGAFHPYKAKTHAATSVAPVTRAAKRAPDLNAPIDTQPTIGSEINRGTKAAFDCSLQHVSDALAFGECVSDAISADEQKQPNSLPFEVGALWGECTSEALLVKTDLELAPTNSVAAEELPSAQRELALSYKAFRHYQEKLGVTDQQLVAAVDDLSEAGRQSSLAQLHSWEQQPPQGGAGSQ